MQIECVLSSNTWTLISLNKTIYLHLVILQMFFIQSDL